MYGNPILCSVALARMGQRIPLAHKFARILEDLIIKDCGVALQIPNQLTHPQVQESHLLGNLFEEHSQSENKFHNTSPFT